MAVVSAFESRGERTAPITYEAGPPARIRRSASTVWIVTVDSVDDGPIVARSASELPNIGQQHPEDTRLICVKKDPKPDPQSELKWRVSIDYEDQPWVNDPDENPLAEPPEISWDYEETRIPIQEDRDGNAITNSAGQSFDPPIEEDFADAILTITRNEASVNVPQLIQYANAVNLDTFQGAAPGQAKMKPITAARQYHAATQTYYWRHTYKILFREDGWTRRILDEGRYSKSGSGELLPIKINGEHVTDPVKLDGLGGVNYFGTPAYILVPPWKERNFGVFGLPNAT